MIGRHHLNVALATCTAISIVLAGSGRRVHASDALSASIPELPPTLSQYCITCHSDRLKTGGLSLESSLTGSVAEHAEIFEKVLQKLRSGAMPPAGRPRPPRAVVEALSSSLETALDAAERAHPDPGGPLLHRLNRAEYANAIRDLLALDVDAATLLPPDDSTPGFDNIADVLGVSPALLERYLTAAGEISALAVGDPSIRRPTSRTYRVRGDTSQTEHLEGLPLGTRGGCSRASRSRSTASTSSRSSCCKRTSASMRGLEYPAAARNHRRRRARASRADSAARRLREPAGQRDRRRRRRSTRGCTVRRAGESRPARRRRRRSCRRPPRRAATGSSRSCAATSIATDHTGLAARRERLTITGPFNADAAGRHAEPRADLRLPAGAGAPTRSACATTILSTLARRAYRRPVDRRPTSTRCWRSTRPAARTARFDGGHRAGAAAASWRARSSCSASSAIRPTLPPARPIAISDLELASRLSFFLWSSIPDDELLTLAAQRQAAATRRCSSSRCAACSPIREPTRSSSNFAGQWLYLRNLQSDRRPTLRRVPGLRRQPAAGVPQRDGAVLRQHHARGPQRARSADAPTTRS